MPITYSEYSALGTSGNDILFATWAANPSLQFTSAYSGQGDDTIVRDRTGAYHPAANYGPEFTIAGSSGFDIVSYMGATRALTASLDAGYASLNNSSGSTFDDDDLFEIEGLIGTVYGDLLNGDEAANRLWGHDGHDRLFGLDGRDTVWGGQGNDSLWGGLDHDTLHGENGNDSLIGGDGSDLGYGGAGHDTLHGGDELDMLQGDGGNDRLYGDDGNDLLDGGEGNDRIEGGAGQDAMQVGAGDDTVIGGSDNDNAIVAGAGDNLIDGGSGFDKVVYTGNAAVDVSLWSGTATRSDGTDTLVGVEAVETGGGADVVFGAAGLNILRTNGGHDVVFTLGGNDHLTLGSGNDVGVGYGGNETMLGGSGHDTLQGNGGEDELYGESGDDLIEGGDEDDVLWGGADADTFLWRAGHQGTDIVEDFQLGTDRIAFGEGYFVGQTQPGFDVRDALYAMAHDGDAYLVANLAGGSGWTEVAQLDGVGQAAVNQKIDNLSIFDPEVSALGDTFDDLFG